MRSCAWALVVVVLGTACAERQEPLNGALRLRRLPPAGDTLRWAIEGSPHEGRLVRPSVEAEVIALDASGSEQLSRVRHVLALRDGRAVVHDEAANRVVLVDGNGRPLRTIGGPGGGPGEFGTIYGMTLLPDDRLALWDGTGARINLYAPDGTFIASATVPPGGLSTNDGLFSDGAGGLYRRALLHFEATAPERNVTGLVRVDTVGAGDSIAFPRLNPSSPALLARMPNGMTVSGGAVPYLPRDHVRLLPGRGLVVGPGDPYHLLLLAPDGPPVRIERAHTPVMISPDESSALRRRIESELREIDPSWTWTAAPIPATKPAYRGIDVDREGRIWVLVSTPTLDAPGQEASTYDVYQADGAPIARVELPLRSRFAAATGEQLWIVRLDSLDVPVIGRARLDLPAGIALPRRDQ